MKLKQCISLMISAVFTVSVCTAVSAEQTPSKVEYNFGAENSENAVNINNGAVPYYTKEAGYGFVSKTGASPARFLNSSKIVWTSEGFKITEDGSGAYLSNLDSSAAYNYGGLVFRADVAEAGAYKITVELNSSDETTAYVAPNGMQASRILSDSYWDAAHNVPIRNHAEWTSPTTWEYTFVTGEPYIEIEVEPNEMPTAEEPKTVGIKSVSIEKQPKAKALNSVSPTIFVLGDSTEKTYTFEEAGMSGWGQIISRMFNTDKVRVVNYSMGGRSMKSMFTENRFNDILLTARPGDYVFLHSAHNDESTGSTKGPEARFGRGSTAQSYSHFLNDIYIPAMRSRGIIPVLVTAMPRMSDGVPKKGFNPDSVEMMKAAAEANEDVYVADLFSRAKEYEETVGPEMVKAIYMSIEAGESPGKTNSGSYANGHPDNKIDGTHYKEAASKVWCRLIADIIYNSEDMETLKGYLADNVQKACQTGDWSEVFPEWAEDVTFAYNGSGNADTDPAYYRNQIEKMLQLGVMKKDSNGNFNPLNPMNTSEFINALAALWGIDPANPTLAALSSDDELTREDMAQIALAAYTIRYGKNADGTYKRPAYMTDYNGTTVSPDDPNYDPNLTGDEAQYYPLAGWNALTDKDKISPNKAEEFKEAYNLGLIRSDKDIKRGKMENGTELEPQKTVTRAKAAKELWFLWVLGQENVLAENQITTITTDGKTYVPIK